MSLGKKDIQFAKGGKRKEFVGEKMLGFDVH